MRVGKKAVTDLCTAIDGDEAMQHRIATDGRFLVDETIRTDVRSLSDAGTLGDHGGGVNARGGPLGMTKKIRGMRQSRGRVWREEVRRTDDAPLALPRAAVLCMRSR